MSGSSPRSFVDHELFSILRLFAFLHHPSFRTFAAIEELITRSLSSQINLITR